jgi:hypothetical protein
VRCLVLYRNGLFLYKNKFEAFAEVTDRRERNVPLLAIANKELDLLFCSAEEVVRQAAVLARIRVVGSIPYHRVTENVDISIRTDHEISPVYWI